MQRSRIVVLAGLVAACCLALLSAGNAAATPLLAMQAAAKCNSCHALPDRSDPAWVESNYALAARRCRATCGSCHVNPDGGMLRTAAGQYFGERHLPLKSGLSAPLEKGLSLIKDNQFLTFGGDFRLLDILATDQEDKKSPLFFPMQGDIYLGSRMSDNISLLTQFGLQRGGNSEVREIFALVDRLPYNGYLKFGKFMPPFGHRLEDHTAFIRKELFVDQSNPVSYSSGVEIGADPLVFYGRLAYMNEDVLPAGNSDATSTVYSGVFGWQGLWLQIGGSFLRINDNRNWGSVSDSTAGSTGDRTAYGGYGSVNFRRLTWLFEYDMVKNEFSGDGTDCEEFISFNELNFLAFRGTTFKVRYETLDPNRDIEDDESTRSIAGLEFHPFPFTELDVQYRYNDTPEENYGQVLAMIHLWY